MRIGLSLFFQNYDDWERYDSRDFSVPAKVPDSQIVADELRLGRLAEPLGFDSLWTVEHHFTPYNLVPNPLQLLAYYAGNTQRIDLGTMVIVLPWHDPIRIAEEISVLDCMLEGRKLTLGLGRGAGEMEFAGLRTDMGKSRDLFAENLAILRAALGNETFSYDGEFTQIPELAIRPRRRSDDLLDGLLCAWGSPASLPIAAREGLGMLFIPQKPWAEYEKEVTEFNRIRAEIGLEPDRPIVCTWVYCAETEEEARENAREYMGKYWDSAQRHYGLRDPEHFRNVKGYEFYAERGESILKQTETREEVDARFADQHVWGTPEMCIEKIRSIGETLNARELISVMKFGGMPLETAEKSIRLYSEKVLPVVRGA